ncbi:unnamed protein product [Phytophthora fragariaefolia]|uniref:Unnamed protein product n=1 Tax=Phytophthora fragariaefolia TaxID=1490495 RepID=A0A9W6XA24_9STRA|nr:unnamed protein product [Phytophthora fragariaefolia]
MTCYAIWHQLWRNGTSRLQSRCGRGIQMRGPGKKQEEEEDEGDDGNASNDNPGGADAEVGASTAIWMDNITGTQRAAAHDDSKEAEEAAAEGEEEDEENTKEGKQTAA